jgi:type VI secretion system protein ImpH
LISLLYRVRKKMRLGFDFQSPDKNAFHTYFFSLMGQGTGSLKGRLQVPDRSLLFYTGLLSTQPRSMIGLEYLLKDFFQVPVRGVQFRGRWYNLEDSQTTRIGRFGKNRRLGQDIVLGTRVWDQERMFHLAVGPLTLRQFEDFLPLNPGFKHLTEIVRFYTGDEFDFKINLLLKAPEVPASRLSSRRGPRLGWTSWLRTHFFRHDDDQVTISADYQPIAHETSS